MYAVIETGGKQVKVAVGDTVDVERIPLSAGETVELDRVLLVADGDQVMIGHPLVEEARVHSACFSWGLFLFNPRRFLK